MRKLNLNEMKHLARKQGGLCLSKKYVNSTTKLKWLCKNNHPPFRMAPREVKYQEQWCPLCANSRKGQYRKLNIKIIQNFVKSKWNGLCLSTEYIGNNKKLRFKCSDGHPFEMTSSAVMNEGSWCRLCRRSFYRSEEIVRKLFEYIFEREFPTVKPNWLKNDRGYSMELDGYNEELKIAFEYQGEHHYQPIRYGNVDPYTRLSQRKKDDKHKKKLCKRNGILLIEIPHTMLNTSSSTEYEKTGNYILQQCKLNDIVTPKQNYDFDINKLKLMTRPDKLLSMQEYAKTKGGKCFAKSYVSSKAKVKWGCGKHTWSQSYKEVMGNKSRPRTWCPFCARDLKHQELREKYGNFDRVKKYAIQKGGKCLSTTYVNAHSKLEFICGKGDKWFANANRLLNGGHWCPRCGGTGRLTIDDMHKLAHKNKGKCLSKIYKNNRTKLRWLCKNNHKFMMTPSHVQQGHWCKKCRTAHSVIKTKSKYTSSTL